MNINFKEMHLLRNDDDTYHAEFISEVVDKSGNVSDARVEVPRLQIVNFETVALAVND